MAKPIPYNVNRSEQAGPAYHHVLPHLPVIPVPEAPRPQIPPAEHPPAIRAQEAPRQDSPPAEPAPALNNRHLTFDTTPSITIPARPRPTVNQTQPQSGPLAWAFQRVPLFWRVLFAILAGSTGGSLVVLRAAGTEIPVPVWLTGLFLLGSVFYLGAVTRALNTIETAAGNIQLLGIVVLSSGGVVFSLVCLAILACALLVLVLYLGMKLIILCVDLCFGLLGLLFGRNQ